MKEILDRLEYTSPEVDGEEYVKPPRPVPWFPIIVVVLAAANLTWVIHGAIKKPEPKPPHIMLPGDPCPVGEVCQSAGWTWSTSVLTAPDPQPRWDKRPHLSAPTDHPPSIVRVGNLKYTVHYTSGTALAAKDAYALTVITDREIWLNPERKELREDLIHELMHCAADWQTAHGRFFNHTMGINDNEGIIEATSAGLLEILRDNPELERWLLQ